MTLAAGFKIAGVVLLMLSAYGVGYTHGSEDEKNKDRGKY